MAAMTTPRPVLHALLAVALASALSPADAADAPAPAPASAAAATAPVFRFDGKPFVHRWSKGGQHEFTPPAQPDLDNWQDMVTVQLYDHVSNADQLAFVANGVLVAYQKSGLIVRTNSLKATPQRPAEHMVVAILQDQGVREMVFARFRLAPEGGGQAVVYSHRVYGMQPDAAASAWFREHDLPLEKAMMTWTDIPSVAALRALPQSPS
jgi:hypothetical protein